MTPVYQTTPNNCLSAAVASVLDRPLGDIPDWSELAGIDYLKALAEWAVQQQLGFCFFDFKDRKDWPLLINHYVIVAGDTSRSEKYFHAIVAKATWDGTETRLEYIHDPYKYGDYITKPDHCLFFVPQNSANQRLS